MAIFIPQKRPNKPVGGVAQAAGTVGGGILGAIIGGPMGALTGASAGGALGGGVGGTADQMRGQPKPVQGIPGSQDAMARRMQELNQGKEKLNTIREGLMALPEVDPETRAKAAPILTRGYLQELERGFV